MRTLRNLIILTFSGALLAACTGPDIVMIEKMPTKGGAFEKALHAGYVKLAKDEAAEGDYADADHFANKAAMVANGENVKPDRVFDRDLPQKYVKDAELAWQKLAVARSGGAKEKAPGYLAEAQTMFDCWIQEAEEDIQRTDISRCQIGFNAAMAEVAKAMKPQMAAKPAAPARAAPAKDSHMIYFSFNSASLTPVSMSVISAAAKSIAAGNKAVFVLGHADRSGSDAYNKALADRRANAVIAALRKAGVKGGISKVTAGERDPAVATADGVKEGQNRRVEIAILK